LAYLIRLDNDPVKGVLTELSDYLAPGLPIKTSKLDDNQVVFRGAKIPE